MYNETLARGILSVLGEAFPNTLGLHDLKRALREFADLPDDDWLVAIDALYKEGYVDGVFSRLGSKGVLRGVANLEITAAGRQHLRDILPVLHDSPKDDPGDLDPLLQIFNRGRFDSGLTEFSGRATKEHPLSLVMIDIDHFKNVNDRYGHPAGDDVLTKIAVVLQSVSMNKGPCYRYGGEELAVLLSNYTLEEAVAFAERVRLTIAQGDFSPFPDRVTISLGVATMPDHAQEAEALKREADNALYQAKRLGRNLVRVVGDPETVPAPIREVKRRLPDPTGLTEDQAKEIRQSYFRGYEVRCPRDKALLKVFSSHVVGRRTPDLFVSCPICGFQEHLEGD